MALPNTRKQLDRREAIEDLLKKHRPNQRSGRPETTRGINLEESKTKLRKYKEDDTKEAISLAQEHTGELGG